MSANVWDDRGITEHPTAVCQACGQIQWVWVAFEGYGKGWQVCEDCLREATKALDEYRDEHDAARAKLAGRQPLTSWEEAVILAFPMHTRFVKQRTGEWACCFYLNRDNRYLGSDVVGIGETQKASWEHCREAALERLDDMCRMDGDSEAMKMIRKLWEMPTAMGHEASQEGGGA